MNRIIILSDEEKAAALADASVWVVMQNDSPIGVAFSEDAAQYQADSAQYQYPFTRRASYRLCDYPLGVSWAPTPHFHVRGPYTVGRLDAL